jgi:hypothetical protein
LANTPKKIYVGTPGTSSATIYTVPASTTTIVKNIVMCNTTSSNAVITVATGGKNIISSYSVAANDTVTIDLSLILAAGDTITAVQTTSNAINLFLSGVEVV